MYFINRTPSESGNYGNPQTHQWNGALKLPDELLDDYIRCRGFVVLTVEDGVVQALACNEAALQAYLEECPDPAPPTAAELREKAYNDEKIIEWDGDMITVTNAAELWNYYAAEGSDKADVLQDLIAEAKRKIRDRYPD